LDIPSLKHPTVCCPLHSMRIDKHFLHCILGALLALLKALPAHATDHAVILQYHHFGSDTPPSTSVTLPQFDAHLEYLAEHDYRIWPLDRIISHLREHLPFPEKVVAITIDDAYRSVYREAWPRLSERGWPFTVFVATDAVDDATDAMMSWQQMRELAASGVTFANHSGSHAHLVRRNPDESESAWRKRVRSDLQRAQKRLQQELGRAPMLFAYPYGEYDMTLRELVGELGFTAFGQQSGPVSGYSDPLSLPRFPMAVAYASLDEVAEKLQSLPLPVLRTEPRDPVLPAGTGRPLLRITLQPGSYRPDTVACYVSGQGRIQPVWLDAAHTRFEVRAASPLPAGRSRYNCTAHSSAGAGWLWYSHLWIRRNADGSWYPE